MGMHSACFYEERIHHCKGKSFCKNIYDKNEDDDKNADKKHFLF
jgi:hypothetical protein